MKNLIVYVAILVCYSIASSKHVTQSVYDVRTDNLYLSDFHYDSIYVYHGHLLDRSKDTIYLKDVSIEHHYKLLRDTICIIQRDSIPYTVRIETIKEIPRKRNIFDYISYACLGLLLGTVLTMLFRSRNRL